MTDFTAKVKVCGKSKSGQGEYRILFDGDYADGANKEWALATPAINIGMNIKPELAAKLHEGHSVTLTFHIEDTTPPTMAEERATAPKAMADYPLPSEGLETSADWGGPARIRPDDDGNKGMC